MWFKILQRIAVHQGSGARWLSTNQNVVFSPVTATSCSAYSSSRSSAFTSIAPRGRRRSAWSRPPPGPPNACSPSRGAHDPRSLSPSCRRARAKSSRSLKKKARPCARANCSYSSRPMHRAPLSMRSAQRSPCSSAPWPRLSAASSVSNSCGSRASPPSRSSMLRSSSSIKRASRSRVSRRRVAKLPHDCGITASSRP